MDDVCVQPMTSFAWPILQRSSGDPGRREEALADQWEK